MARGELLRRGRESRRQDLGERLAPAGGVDGGDGVDVRLRGGRDRDLGSSQWHSKPQEGAGTGVGASGVIIF